MLKAVLYPKHGVCNHPSIPQVDAIFPSYFVRNGARPGDSGTGLRSGNSPQPMMFSGRVSEILPRILVQTMIKVFTLI